MIRYTTQRKTHRQPTTLLHGGCEWILESDGQIEPTRSLPGDGPSSDLRLLCLNRLQVDSNLRIEIETVSEEYRTVWKTPYHHGRTLVKGLSEVTTSTASASGCQDSAKRKSSAIKHRPLLSCPVRFLDIQPVSLLDFSYWRTLHFQLDSTGWLPDEC